MLVSWHVVETASNAMVEELDSNPVLVALVRRQQQEAEAAQHWAVRASKGLLRRSFRCLRSRVRRQQKINIFRRRRVKAVAQEIALLCIAGWRHVVQVSRRGQQLLRWKQRKLKVLSWGWWRSLHYVWAVQYPHTQHRLARLKLRRGLAGLRSHVRAVAAARAQQHRHGFLVAVLTLVRVFKAWRRLTQLQLVTQRRLLDRRRLSTLSICFQHWHNESEEKHAVMASNASTVRAKAQVSLLAHSLGVWVSLYRFALLLSEYKAKRYHLRRWVRRHSTRANGRNRRTVLVAAALKKLTLVSLLRSFRWWSKMAASRVCAARARGRLMRSHSLHLLDGVWRHWFAVLSARKLQMLKAEAVHRFSQLRRMQRSFRQWRVALALLMAQPQRRALRVATSEIYGKLHELQAAGAGEEAAVGTVGRRVMDAAAATTTTSNHITTAATCVLPTSSGSAHYGMKDSSTPAPEGRETSRYMGRDIGARDRVASSISWRRQDGETSSKRSSEASSSAHCRSSGAPAYQEIKGKNTSLRSGFSDLEFSLLFLDDFDDQDDDQEGACLGERRAADAADLLVGAEHANEELALPPPAPVMCYCVRLRRCLWRWALRARRLRQLRLFGIAVGALRGSRLRRRCFNHASGCWLRAALTRQRALQIDLSVVRDTNPEVNQCIIRYVYIDESLFCLEVY